jgi:hypothetical protein
MSTARPQYCLQQLLCGACFCELRQPNQMDATTTHGPTWGHVVSGKTEDVFQTIVKSRKGYKMLKGAAEAVWPPYLEEALLKGMKRSVIL